MRENSVQRYQSGEEMARDLMACHHDGLVSGGEEELLPAKLNEALEIVTRTDPGKVREHNEDAVFANPNQGAVILADGMGVYSAGEAASGMATMLLSNELEGALDCRGADEIDRATCYFMLIAAYWKKWR